MKITGLPDYPPKKLALFGFLLGIVSGMYSQNTTGYVSIFIADTFAFIGLICLVVGLYRWIKGDKEQKLGS